MSTMEFHDRVLQQSQKHDERIRVLLGVWGDVSTVEKNLRSLFREKIYRSYSDERFRSNFGLSTKVMADIWLLTEPDQHNFELEHILWLFYFIHTANTFEVCSSRFGVCSKVFSQKMLLLAKVMLTETGNVVSLKSKTNLSLVVECVIDFDDRLRVGCPKRGLFKDITYILDGTFTPIRVPSVNQRHYFDGKKKHGHGLSYEGL